MFKFAQPVIPSTYFIPLRLILYFTILQYYNITILQYLLVLRVGSNLVFLLFQACKALDLVDEPAA